MPRFEPEKNNGKKSIQLSSSVHEAIEEYFEHMDGNNQDCDGLYALVLSEVERPLLKCVMHHCNDNRTAAAKMLGMNRATLRKKLEQYELQ